MNNSRRSEPTPLLWIIVVVNLILVSGMLIDGAYQTAGAIAVPTAALVILTTRVHQRVRLLLWLLYVLLVSAVVLAILQLAV